MAGRAEWDLVSLGDVREQDSCLWAERAGSVLIPPRAQAHQVWLKIYVYALVCKVNSIFNFHKSNLCLFLDHCFSPMSEKRVVK